MRYEFKDGSWKSDFSHCYSILTNKFPSFTELEDHIVNRATEGGFEWISIVHNDRFTEGSRVSVECSFDSYGAPLITLANSLWTDKEGNNRRNAEVVADNIYFGEAKKSDTQVSQTTQPMSMLDDDDEDLPWL